MKDNGEMHRLVRGEIGHYIDSKCTHRWKMLRRKWFQKDIMVCDKCGSFVK